MGSWGTGIFDNDAALDWAAELERGDRLDFLRATFADTFAEEYVDADVACASLAAAEVVAALAGQATPGLPDNLKGWVRGAEVELTSTDVALALRSVERVRAHDSELLELWSEGDSPEAFLAVLHELEARLHAAGA